VEQFDLGNIEKSTKLDQFSREELINKYTSLEDEYHRAIKEIYRLKNQHLTESQLNLVLQEHLQELNQKIYGASSERYKKPKDKPKDKEPPKPRIKRPSERYPNVPVREVHLTIDPIPSCDACGEQMQDSGMTEESEQLTVIPKKFEIVRNIRSVYRCQCHSCMKTAPNPPRIVEGSTYSDEMILDVVLSKYCDLIPIERYVQMAARGGLVDLPPNTLIDLTHRFAFFVKEIYRKIGEGILQARVLKADETPHRMLERSEKKTWYLWGFSTDRLCFLECHDTRSGDVASRVLLKSKCEVLLTDVYAGYGKGVRVANQERIKTKLPMITSAYCNAHVRRNFFKIRERYPESYFYLDHYHEIYQLESEAKGKSSQEVLRIREKMRPRFEAMRDQAMEELPRYPKGNKYEKALNYLLNDYAGFTLCLKDAEVPLDNNAQERLLRSHVVGRKTWYGTHSEQGAETAAILFSIVETCKLNQVNPREYFPALVKAILNRQKALTPSEWKVSQLQVPS
jgi:transposase